MRSPSLAAASLLVFAAACGARSTLRDPGGGASTGSGGTGSTTTAIATATSSAAGPGSGPGGGPSFECAGLINIEPPVEVPTASDGTTAARNPLLELLGTGDVLALVRGVPLTTPDFTPTSVASVRLAPWMLWPPSIHPPNVIYQPGYKTPFVAAVEPQGTFALGVERYPLNNPTGCDLDALFGLVPDAPGPGPGSVSQSMPGTCEDAPVGIATAGDGTHLVANDLMVQGGNPGSRILKAVLLDPKGGLLVSLDPYCASSHFVGDMLSVEGGLFFVHSSSDGGPCISSPGPQGAARNLVLHRLHDTVDTTESVYSGDDDLVYARVLPRQDGAWLIYRESGASALVQPPGMALPVGLQQGSGSAFPITDSGAGQMAVAALGGGFVVAVVDSVDPSAPTVLLRVYSGAGLVLAETSFSTNGAWLNGDRLTLIASPDSTSFLVGWTGTTSKPTSTLFLRRFDCALAL